MWLALLACTSDDPKRDRPDPTTDADADTDTDTDSDADADADADADSDSDADTDTQTDPPDPCDVDPSQSVIDVTTDQPWHENELEISFGTTVAATAAVACTLATDSTEVHLVEDVAVGTSHTLRIPGLLADSDYDCVAAAVCPASAAPATFSVHTGERNAKMVDVNVDTTPNAGLDYILVNHAECWDQSRNRVEVIDRDGNNRWWFDTPVGVGVSMEFRYHGGNLFEWGGGWGPNELARPRLVDLFDGEIYDSAAAMPGLGEYHHDGKMLPDGKLLTLERVDVEGDFGTFDGFQVRRIDPATDTVDFVYDSQRAVDEGHIESGFGDAWHPNWTDLVDGTLYVSLCELAKVVAIDEATGDFLWTFGAGGDFELFDENGDPLGNSGFTSCQHGLDYTEDDHLFVYDNGWNRGYTRVSEYVLDPVAFTATRLWTWTEPDWYESTVGDIDPMPSGKVLIGAGHPDCFGDNPGDHTTLIELDPVTGVKDWELQFDDKDIMAYRADYADPCTLFANARYCADTATRLAELATVLGN
ncbi:MAG: aryl-sulfate sulfotransferase [Myxococcota bacterium]